jgi:hypothetical protein
MPPVIQVTRRGTVINDADVAALRRAFAERHCAKLTGLLDPGLAGEVRAQVERGTFQEYGHGSIARELRLDAGVATGLLHFLTNDPRLFRLVESVSGCTGIGAFAGRVYRRLAGGPHYVDWHDDLDGRRLVGMSINLSADAYEGGVLEIRDAVTQRSLAALPNVGFGDAIVFRLSDAIQHRVSEVRGAVPKTAFAGWFFADLNFEQVLHDTGVE